VYSATDTLDTRVVPGSLPKLAGFYYSESPSLVQIYFVFICAADYQPKLQQAHSHQMLRSMPNSDLACTHQFKI
jgi:hypothetical protein